MNQSHTPVTLTRLRGPLAATLCALSLAPLAHSADFTWTAPSGGNWDTPANWADGNVANGAGDRAVFTPGSSYAVDLNGETITLGGLASNFTAGGLDLRLSNGIINLDNSGSAPTISLTQRSRILVSANTQLTGSNGFTFSSSNVEGKLVLMGANSYSGVTRVTSGFLEIRDNNSLGATGAGNHTLIDAINSNGNPYPRVELTNNVSVDEDFRVRLFNGGGGGYQLTFMNSLGNSANTINGTLTLDRAGGGRGLYEYRVLSQQSLTLNGNITGTLSNALSDGATSAVTTLRMSTANATSTLKANGIIADGTLAGIGGLGVLVDGNGTTELTNANTYSGGTIVKSANNTATLLVNNTTGSATGTGALTVSSTGRLVGAGIIAPNNAGILFESGARVLPGNSDVAGEKLTFDLSGVSDPQYIVDFQSDATIGINISAANGASYFVFTGLSFQDQVVFNNNVVDFNLLGDTPLADGLYTLAQFTGSGSYTGEWVLGSGLEAYGDVELLFTDSSIQLRVGVIPEPGTWAAIFGGIALISCVVIKRRKR